MSKQILLAAAALVQFSTASAHYPTGGVQAPTIPESAIVVTFDSLGSGVDTDAINEITAILEEGPDTVISQVEWRKESSSPQVQLCVTFARPVFMQSFKSRFEKVLEGLDERTTLSTQAYCN